ncbi:MAG TPA: membrane-binding protein [Leptospiraceae bacterium]|nr:membrane-binding protein [Leptospiraceae bacterium]
MNKKFFLLLLSLLLIHCGPEIHMDNDPNFTLGYESVFSYKGVPYTGIMLSVHPNGVRRETEYKDGLEHGKTSNTYADGRPAAEYFFEKGKRIGIHKGWYENGKPRFWYEYKDGMAHGDHWEWHEEGIPYRYGRFENNVNIGQKVWRKDGQIYSNYIYTEQRIYGVQGSKLCFKLKGDETNTRTVVK